MPELLRLHVGIGDELRRRDVIRSANGPTGDYGELLFSRAFGWKLNNNSASGYDATSHSGERYQIKCRRITAESPSRQLSALRRLDQDPFDMLAAILFDANFEVQRAAIIPIGIVRTHSSFTQHVNAWRFMLRDAIWLLPEVRDVTRDIVRAQASL